LYFPDNSSHCLTHIFYFTSPSTTHQQKWRMKDCEGCFYIL
jgi:hypothetical protein